MNPGCEQYVYIALLVLCLCNWLWLYLDIAVTEKVWESESTDESDPEMTAQRGVGGAKPSLVKPQQWSPAKGTKQSLLMKFFKK